MNKLFTFIVVPFVLLSWWNSNSQTSLHNKGSVYIGPESQIYIPGELVNFSSAEFINDGQVFLFGNFHNEGIMDFFLPTGATHFVGQQPQQISGAEESYLQDVYFDNTSSRMPFQLSGAISVNGIAFFRNGIVDQETYGGSFSFGAEADQKGASAKTHIHGTVIRYGNRDFSFPVGDSEHSRPLWVYGLPASKEQYEVTYVSENPDKKFPHKMRADVIELINDQEYWVLEKTGGEEIMISLSWNSAITPAGIFAEPQEETITIVRWDEETNMWVDEGGEVDTGRQTVTTAIAKDGIFTLGRVKTDRILPCDLVIYNAVTPNGDGVNDFFLIDQSNTQCATNLHVQIFNQWGSKVYEEKDYGINGRVFNGYSNQKLTINGSKKLPTGFYFFVLEYEMSGPKGPERVTKTGYINLSGN